MPREKEPKAEPKAERPKRQPEPEPKAEEPKAEKLTPDASRLPAPRKGMWPAPPWSRR